MGSSPILPIRSGDQQDVRLYHASKSVRWVRQEHRVVKRSDERCSLRRSAKPLSEKKQGGRRQVQLLHLSSTGR